MKVLVTSTSFQDSPGRHQDMLNDRVGKENLVYLRGPLNESQLLELDWQFDAVLCGDDAYTKDVLSKAQAGGLKILSKYGVGLDKMDLVAAREFGVSVHNCLGVNQSTVAEHALAMMLAYSKNIPECLAITRQGEWKRPTGSELSGKKLGIIGLGRIGKELAKRARAFDMNVVAYDQSLDREFIKAWQIEATTELMTGFKDCDFLSLHCNLNKDSENLLGAEFFHYGIKPGVVLVNTARAGLVDREALIEALNNKKLAAYLTDVWFEEPMRANDPLKDNPKVWITPHVGSRTRENVEKQGLMAVENLLAAWEKL